ncbi:MAG: hypothetical protein ISS70_20850 [Phycisphaerae bacterium]|nr:hypothetical protein [Phycisphaerae bacterium]
MNFRRFPVTTAVLLAISFNVTLQAQDATRLRQANNITKEQRIDNWLNSQDKNADGKIAGDEATGLMNSNFTRNDTNKDNFLDRKELGDLAERLARGGFGRNRQPRDQQTMTTEQLLKQLPEGVTVVPDIDFVKALREAGAKDVTYMRYKDGSGHGTFFANIKETGPAREKFFERTLKGRHSKYVFTIRNGKTFLNDKSILVKGLRCSNALVSDESAAELIANLDTFASFGINTVSVFFMGSRFGDMKGYNRDGSLNPVYTARMGRIIEAADERGMVVLVGCLYWGNSKAKWEEWKQAEANAAIANTVRWLKEHDYRNVFVDVDNEGMAKRAKGFDNRLLVVAGKKVDPTCVIATNFKGPAPPEADLGLHFSAKVPGKPYIESEGTPTHQRAGRLLGQLQQEERLLQLHQHRPLQRRNEGQAESPHSRAPRQRLGIYVCFDLAAVPAAVGSEQLPRRRRLEAIARHPMVARIHPRQVRTVLAPSTHVRNRTVISKL